ncbi:hypothetical protein V8B97DRAFT_1913367 [Scleroderma yunnanense]
MSDEHASAIAAVIAMGTAPDIGWLAVLGSWLPRSSSDVLDRSHGSEVIMLPHLHPTKRRVAKSFDRGRPGSYCSLTTIVGLANSIGAVGTYQPGRSRVYPPPMWFGEQGRQDPSREDFAQPTRFTMTSMSMQYNANTARRHDPNMYGPPLASWGIRSFIGGSFRLMMKMLAVVLAFNDSIICCGVRDVVEFSPSDTCATQLSTNSQFGAGQGLASTVEAGCVVPEKVGINQPVELVGAVHVYKYLPQSGGRGKGAPQHVKRSTFRLEIITSLASDDDDDDDGSSSCMRDSHAGRPCRARSKTYAWIWMSIQRYLPLPTTTNSEPTPFTVPSMD